MNLADEVKRLNPAQRSVLYRTNQEYRKMLRKQEAALKPEPYNATNQA